MILPGHILCLGLSYRTAALDVRERWAFPAPVLGVALARAAASPEVDELLILSTCNRVELYAHIAHAEGDPFEPLRGFLAHTHENEGFPPEEALYTYAGLDAAAHLARVAAGLDAMVVGEPQILGQVSRAYEQAVEAGSAGPALKALVETALRAGRRARAETGVGRHPASVPSVAVHLARQVVGPLEDQRVLVIGAGEMGSLIAKYLHGQGVRTLTVASRRPERAAAVADRWGCHASSLADLPTVLNDADVVLAATSAPPYLLDRDAVAEALSRRTRPMVLIDLSVPRNVDPAVLHLHGVFTYDLDAIQAEMHDALAERRRAEPHVEAIIREEVDRFDAWLRQAALAPVITDLRRQAEAIRRESIEQTLRRLPGLDDEARRQVQHLSHTLVNRLLHHPTLHLRHDIPQQEADEYAALVRRLFALPTGT